MKDVGTEQWELATNVGATNAILQSNVKNNNIIIKKYIYTQLKIKSPNLELAK